MEGKIKVLFGHSVEQPDVIVTQKIWQEEMLTDEEGNDLGLFYNEEAESWMARNDMSWSIFTISAESFDALQGLYADYVRASWEDRQDRTTVERFKQAFLQALKH